MDAALLAVGAMLVQTIITGKQDQPGEIRKALG
jgi:hypothetical protein